MKMPRFRKSKRSKGAATTSAASDPGVGMDPQPDPLQEPEEKKSRRPKLSFAGWKDPGKRTRYIVWIGVLVVGGLMFTAVALGVTSSYWFCAEGCHKVQDDTIIAYNMSAHTEVSCMACHMPAGADPVTFMLHKVEALGELYLTVTNSYSLPLNEGSHLALDAEHMGSGQCTQCHSENREITPSEGIIIDHVVHEEGDIHCTVCHNRTAHPEDGFELTLTDPNTGEPNQKHDDFMTMTACFRCHGHDDEALAPGDCLACHPEDFPLKPESHDDPEFYPSGHAELALEEQERQESAEATVVAASLEAEEEGHEEEGEAHLPTVGEVNSCETCHTTQFCEDCHGIPMPHPANFTEGHSEVGNERPDVCLTCHATESGPEEFCNNCHHEGSDPAVSWLDQHYVLVRQNGAEGCFECHNPTYCAECHVRGVQ
jgi:hypothetical protein